MRKITFIILILSFFLSGCITTVSRINKKPHRYDKKKVIVLGRVVSSLSLSDLNCFTIRGINNRILVVTPNYLPLKKDFVLVKGSVETKYQYAKRTFLVINEDKKRPRKPVKSKNLGSKLKH